MSKQTQKQSLATFNAEWRERGLHATIRKNAHGEYEARAYSTWFAFSHSFESTFDAALATVAAVIRQERARALYSALEQARLVLEKAGAWLTVSESVVTFTGQTGTHSLVLGVSSAERILAHAKGFAEQQPGPSAPDRAYVDAVYSVATHALNAVGKIRRDVPKTKADLNTWLRRWTGARIYQHHPEDGSQLYWSGGDSEQFFLQTVSDVRQANVQTYGDWLDDYVARLRDSQERRSNRERG